MTRHSWKQRPITQVFWIAAAILITLIELTFDVRTADQLKHCGVLGWPHRSR